MTSVSHYRGHLFADLRGYTAFIEKAGNAAGADLVRRFRQLVRDEVGGHSGAEVKTEGDAIYVVFPSASTAVMCGLALIEAAKAATADDPTLPIRMGIGVHAGEAVEMPEGGYIGSAVNLAARVCAVAEEGQVWVTGTVRGIAQASAPVSFHSKGRRRLKGIDEPVDLYQVLPAGTVVPAQRRVARRTALGAAGILGIGALVLVLLFLAMPRGNLSGASPSTVPPTSATLRIGELEIGEYVTDTFSPPLTLAITDPGWALTAQRAASMELLHEADPRGRLAIARLTGVHSDPCNPEGNYPIETGASPEDLIAALREVAFLEDRQTEFLEIGEEEPIQIDRKPGLRVDLTISNGVFAACDPGGNDVALFPLGSESFGALPGDRLRIEAVPVNGRIVTFISATDLGSEPPETQVADFRELADSVVDGVRFQ